jgi:hypothetical protein
LQHHDPVRLRYIEALSRRAAAHQGAVRDLLERKLAQALAADAARYEQAWAAAGQHLGPLVQRFPAAAERLQQLHADGDLPGLRALVVQLETPARSGSLGELVGRINESARAPHGTTVRPVAALQQGAAWPELKALSESRSTWQRLSVDQQLNRSLEKVPDNPGPLNSQLLVLRSLRLMQDISPAYLKRFMAHVEALLWLEGASSGNPGPGAAPSSGQTVRREAEKKRKPTRGKPA